jgi:hypothetical protein
LSPAIRAIDATNLRSAAHRLPHRRTRDDNKQFHETVRLQQNFFKLKREGTTLLCKSFL